MHPAAYSEAISIGRRWALDVLRRRPDVDAPWPTYAERTLAIARRKVAHLSRDPEELDELARTASSAAARVWARPEWWRPVR